MDPLPRRRVPPPTPPHPYAAYSIPSSSSSLNDTYLYTTASPQWPSTPQRSRSACRVVATKSRTTSAPTTTAAAAAAALQQQYETTRLLSRLFAGVTLQWKQVVEQLNAAGVPLTAEGLPLLLQQPSPSDEHSTEPSPQQLLPQSATNFNRAYLHEGLHFDVQTYAARREQERRCKHQQQMQEQRRDASRQRHRCPTALHGTHPYNVRDSGELREPLTEQQLNHYMQAESEEADELARGAEKASAADWTTLTPSAQWLPYVVGGGCTRSGHAARTKGEESFHGTYDGDDDSWDDSRYYGVLYATPSTASHPWRRSHRESLSRCAPCDDDERVDFDPDDETRLRTAVLHGMARSAEKMILGMRQVQQVLPASAEALRGLSTQVSATRSGRVQAKQASTPPRRYGRRRHGEGGNDNNDDHSDPVTQLGYTQPVVKSTTATTSHRRTYSPPLQSPHSSCHPRGRSGVFAKHPGGRRSHSAGEARQTAAAARRAETKIVYPALPAAQRTWIYPRIDDSAVGQHDTPPSGRYERHNDAPPPATHHATSLSKGASTPALRGVTSIANNSVATSMATDAVEPRGRHGGSPQQVRRQLHWCRQGAVADGDGTTVVPASQAVRQIRQAHISDLVHAESEARLRIAVYQESSMKSILQAHFHQLWHLKSEDDAACKRRCTKQTELTSRDSSAVPCSDSNSRRPRTGGARAHVGASAAAASRTNASRPPPSVSVSPDSSPSTTPQLSPIGLGFICQNIKRINESGKAELRATVNALGSHTTREPSSSASTALSAMSDVDAELSAHSLETIDIETTILDPRESPSAQPGSIAPSAVSATSLSPPPPPLPPPPTEEVTASPAQRPSRSLPPPPPTPSFEEQTPTADEMLKPAVVAITAAAANAPWKVLLSPLNEQVCRSEQQTVKKWSICLPPNDTVERSEKRRACTSTLPHKYMGQSAGGSVSVVSTSSRCHGKRLSAETIDATATDADSMSPTEAAALTEHLSAGDRGAVVALELFPANSTRTAARPASLLSPSPVCESASASESPLPLPPSSATEKEVEVPAHQAARLPNTAKDCVTEHEVATHEHYDALLDRAARCRAAKRRARRAEMLGDSSTHSHRGFRDDVTDKAEHEPSPTAPPPPEAAVIAVNENHPSSQLNSAGQDAESTSRVRSEEDSAVTVRNTKPSPIVSSADNHSNNNSSSSSSSDSSIRYDIESASPPAPEAAEVDAGTDYSSVSSFYSSIPECLTTSETNAMGASPPAEPKSTAAVEVVNPEPPLSTEVAGNPEQTALSEPFGPAREEPVLSPPPRLPAP